MKAVSENSRVTLHYIGKLDNGEVFNTITAEEPIVATLGQNEIPPTMETALIGMKIGDTRKIRLPPEEGYGPRQKDLLQTIDNDDFMEKIKPQPGMILSLSVHKDGQEHKVPATVIEVHEKETVVDYNHPLAGHHLNYEVTILAIES